MLAPPGTRSAATRLSILGRPLKTEVRPQFSDRHNLPTQRLLRSRLVGAIARPIASSIVMCGNSSQIPHRALLKHVAGSCPRQTDESSRSMKAGFSIIELVNRAVRTQRAGLHHEALAICSNDQKPETITLLEQLRDCRQREEVCRMGALAPDNPARPLAVARVRMAFPTQKAILSR